VGPKSTSAATWVWPGQNVWPVQELTAGYCWRRRRRSRVLGDKLRNDSGLECYHKPFGGGAPSKRSPELLRWTSTAAAVGVCSASKLRRPLWCDKMLRIREISPGCFLGPRRKESWTVTSMNSRIPTMNCGRERPDLCGPLAPLLDSFLPKVQLDEAHLLSYSTPSGVASSDGGRAWPELGFAVTAGITQEREGMEGLGFQLGGGGVLIAVESRRPWSSALNHRRWIVRPAELHPAAWPKEEDDGLLRCLILKRYLGRAPSGLVRWVATAGLRSGKCILYFFSLQFLILFFSIFCVVFLIWISTFLQDFQIMASSIMWKGYYWSNMGHYINLICAFAHMIFQRSLRLE
jgi:hypothetical protein